ncbi:MAG: DUF3794 domain-containing protein [Sporomusaceae bacterium]|nr:DUF3794 domain-containing protein [Sporomusaceae bacterium]
MDERYGYLPANCIKPPSPLVVKQVIGEQDIQKVVEVCLVVPRRKPAIEQVVDVLVKHLCITSVEVIPHKVIVRGHFEVKALYVACLPSQPVHAVQARYVRFTAAAHIPGCTYGADADAHATVEYIDYSTRRRPFRRLRSGYKKVPAWKKPYYKDDCGCQPDWHDNDCHDHHHGPDCHDGCKPDWHDDCHDHHHGHDCHDGCKPDWHDDCNCKPPHKPKPKPKPPYHCGHCCHEIDVTVIIRVCVKVMADRQIMLYAGHSPNAHHFPIGQLPKNPKG